VAAPWLHLALKALVSGAVIAAASEVARRQPGWGGLIGSLPLVSVLAMTWMWRDGAAGEAIADFALASSAYVIGSLPAFILIAVLLRRGQPFGLALLAGTGLGLAGYLAVGWLARRAGLPV
jgi:hypothetical protein